MSCESDVIIKRAAKIFLLRLGQMWGSRAWPSA